jgi:competence protein ComEC
VQITGSSVPADRAFLMIACFVAAKVLRLPGNPFAALAGAALLTLLHDPRQLFSSGFQMSYAVVASLLVLGLPLAERARRAWQPWRDLPVADWGRARRLLAGAGLWALEAVAITWAATLASTPSSIGNFGLLSPGALLANLIVIPLSSLALVAGFVALLGGLVGLAGIALVMNHAAAIVILAMDWIVQRGVTLPGMYFAAEFRAPWMGPAALALVLASMLAATDRRLGRHAAWWLPPATLVLTLILGVKFP